MPLRPLSVLILLPLLLSAVPSPAADEPLHIYLAPDDHTDYLWSADEETYRKAFVEMLDYYLALADKTDNVPAEFQSRFNCDGSFWLWVYERSKTKAEFERLIGRIRSGHISVPLNPLCCCYGGTPAEAVLRGMYYAGRIERQYGLRLPLVAAIENQTLPYGLVSLWAGAGARYSWKGICNCATRVEQAGDRNTPVYWLTGPDGSRVLMKWYPCRDNQSLGGYAEARRPEQAVEIATSQRWFTRAHPYRTIGLFGQGWDDLKTTNDDLMLAARRLSRPDRRVIVSNQVDYFTEMERRYGDKLPRIGCSFGNEWELLTASLAEVSAGVKRSVERLRGAEALATLVAIAAPDKLRDRSAARQQAWMDLGLYWEHDWTADGPVPRKVRAAWQRRLAGNVQQYVDGLYAESVAALGSLIGGRPRFERFFVFNPLSWSRTDAADFAYSDSAPVYAIDVATGQEVPSQRLVIQGRPFLRVLAEDVPPLGYKVYELHRGQGKPWSPGARVEGRTLENDLVRITLADRGAIEGFFDKQRQREFAQAVEGRWLNDLGPGVGKLAVDNSGPVSVTLVAQSDQPLRHRTYVTLTRALPRVEIRNTFEQNFSEVVTTDFGFRLDRPDVWHEECGAVIRARLLDEGGHYALRTARYDWLTLNHFADISSGGAGLTLSNADSSFMRLGNSSPRLLDIKTPLVRVLLGGQVDGPKLGIPAQDGDRSFLQRFALAAHDAFDPAAAMRFALEHQNRLITGAVTGSVADRDRQYPADRYSLVRVSNPDVLVWAVKPAEEGIEKGLIVRLWNLAHHPSQCTLLPARGLASAHRATHIETDLAPAPVESGQLPISFTAQQMQTFRLKLRAAR